MAPRAIPEMIHPVEGECCVCFRSASEAGLLIKCSQCVNYLCTECEENCAQPLKCPCCRTELIVSPVPAEAEGLIGVPSPLEQELEFAILDADEELLPPLEAPGFVREAFGDINDSFGWDNASWWFDRLAVGQISPVPWGVFETLHSLPPVGMQFAMTHVVYARKTRFGFIDEPDVLVERIQVKLFHLGELEQQWEYNFEFVE